MLLHNLPKVIDIIVYHISIPDSQAIDSILKLVSVLSRDMRLLTLSSSLIYSGELIVYYDKLLPTLLSLMDPQEPEKTSNVFQTLLMMFRNLNGDDIRDHISIIRKYYGPLFGHKTPFVRQFACESYCYLLRHMSSAKKVEIKSASSVSKLAREQGNEQIKELLVILKAVSRKESISEPMVLGISSLLFESIRGVGGQARRNGIDIYKALIDVLVGVNLLREGLDMPEVSLVAILDADKEGFLRSTRALIQTAGRAARNLNGKVIMYADTVTRSMQETIDTTNYRREKQLKYNEEHGITPQQIRKQSGSVLTETNRQPRVEKEPLDMVAEVKTGYRSKGELERALKQTKTAMQQAAKEMDFLEAARLRDEMFRIEEELRKF